MNNDNFLPTKILGQGSDQTKPSDKTTKDASETASDKTNTKNDGADKKVAANTKDPKKQSTDKQSKKSKPPFNAKEVSSHVSKSKKQLKQNYQGFLKQQPLGFGPDTFEQAITDARAFPNTIFKSVKATQTVSVLEFFLLLLPIVICILFIMILGFGDKHFMNMGVRWQSRQFPGLVPDHLIVVLRALIWMSGLMLPIIFLIFLSYFPVSAIFGQTIWTKLLTETLWLICITRLLIGCTDISFGLIFSHISDNDSKLLSQTIVRCIQVMMFLGMSVLVCEAFNYNVQMLKFLTFVSETSMGIILLLMFWRKSSSLIAMFPQSEKTGPIYRAVIQTFETQFQLILLATSSLLVMMAFGYKKAAGFLLYRGYGVFLLIVGSLWVMSLWRHYMQSKQTAAEDNRAQSDLIKSIRRLVSLALFLVLCITFLKMFLLFDPVVILLKSPLLTIQNVQFSIFNILSASLIVASAALVSLLVRVVLNAHIYPTFEVDVGVAYAVNTIINYMIIVLGFFLVLVALGVNLAALTVVAASLSVGIGFGLQTLTENLIAGIILLFGRAVQKGDYITVNNIYGHVEAVGARSVVLRTMDNYEMLIPSKELVNGSIINWSYRDAYIRIHIPVGVTYSADPREVERVLLEAAAMHDKVLQRPEPQVWFTGFGDSAINFSLLVYVDCNTIIPQQLKGQMYFHIWDKLAQAKIEIPFPQQDLHLRSVQFDDDDMATLRRLSQLKQTDSKFEEHKNNNKNHDRQQDTSASSDEKDENQPQD